MQAKADGHVVLLDTFYPGWHAEVDGREQPIRAADLAFRAVAVPPGRHTVRFFYRPTSVHRRRRAQPRRAARDRRLPDRPPQEGWLSRGRFRYGRLRCHNAASQPPPPARRRQHRPRGAGPRQPGPRAATRGRQPRRRSADRPLAVDEGHRRDQRRGQDQGQGRQPRGVDREGLVRHGRRHLSEGQALHQAREAGDRAHQDRRHDHDRPGGQGGGEPQRGWRHPAPDQGCSHQVLGRWTAWRRGR